ncbi:hypothetical protein DHL47_06845 [Streptococcus panodentis]|uniref:Uncharacterized protein n=1 Tax=Streptococcus panodentis TaxID=1581472 RepID=A0ABS5AXQ6_9STRE|nr:hypothetical protein [Streptococcus panodentis]MBP2621041.1 hypothetical protein [Streptococcus panodentis]
MDAVLSVRTKAVNQTSSLSEARPMVEGELRDMDTETSSVVSAIALDESNSQHADEFRDIDAGRVKAGSAFI